MWATIVGNDGAVCAVAFSGTYYTDQWLASRVISAQKASTANSLSLATVSGASSAGQLALATGNLYSPIAKAAACSAFSSATPSSPRTPIRLIGAPGVTA